MSDFKIFLNDILEAITSIEEFIGSKKYNEFVKDDKTSSAVLRKLEIIGEAVKHIPNEIRDEYPQIPWKSVAGLKDKLIHGYFTVDYKLVWGVIENRLPELKLIIIQIIKEIKEG